MVERRTLLAALGSALAAPWPAKGQPAARRHRLGWLGVSAQTLKEPYSLAFERRLAELGWEEGKRLDIERRHADMRVENFHAAASALAKARCDVYFSGGPEAALSALTQADKTTPIVFVAVDFDPVATGDVASMARPGGRVTGVTALQSTLPAKRLELLKEMMPTLTRVAVLSNEQTTGQLALVQGTARRIGIAVQVLDLRRPPFDFEAAFADAVREKAQALFVLGSALWVSARQKIPALALQSKLPTVMHHAQWAEAGGLISYGFNFPAIWQRGAEMVAMVLKGGRPAEIPMEQPTTFELATTSRPRKRSVSRSLNNSSCAPTV